MSFDDWSWKLKTGGFSIELVIKSETPLAAAQHILLTHHKVWSMATQLLGQIIWISKMTIMIVMMIDDGGDVNVDYYVDHDDKDSDKKDNNDHAEIRDAPLYHYSISQERRNFRPICTE